MAVTILKDNELRDPANQRAAARRYGLPVARVRQARRVIDNIRQYLEDHGEWPSPIDVAVDIMDVKKRK